MWVPVMQEESWSSNCDSQMRIHHRRALQSPPSCLIGKPVRSVKSGTLLVYLVVSQSSLLVSLRRWPGVLFQLSAAFGAESLLSSLLTLLLALGVRGSGVGSVKLWLTNTQRPSDS